MRRRAWLAAGFRVYPHLPVTDLHLPRQLRLPLVALMALAMLWLSVSAASARPRPAFPSLALGSRGANVVALQHLLREKRFAVPVSGHFDEATQAAVGGFEVMADLPVDGVADGATWQQLVPALGPGSRGEAVRALQTLLNAKRGAGLAISGTFDSSTGRAVQALKRHARLRLSVDVDTATWRYLVWHYVRPDFAGSSMCSYHSGNGSAAHWGTAEAVGHLEAAAALFSQRTGHDVSVGELSFEHGGNIAGHATHEIGLDVDIGLVRHDGRHCRLLGVAYRDAQYDREMTRELAKAVHETAPHQLKLIYFNDPRLIAEGLVVGYRNHAHHLHVRYCEVGHPERRYRCPAPPFERSEAGSPAGGGNLEDDWSRWPRPNLGEHRF